MMKSRSAIFSTVLVFLIFSSSPLVNAFVSPKCPSQPAFSTRILAESTDVDPNEIVARRIVVEGDVQGGYYRSCVRNEAGRFRRLSGTMTPPDDSKKAEIYVEGKLKMIEGFVRWCKKSDVGLSQRISVSEVTEEDPTGLYDDFYVKVRD